MDELKATKNELLWILIDTPIDSNNRVEINNFLDKISEHIEIIQPKNLIISSQIPIGSMKLLSLKHKLKDNFFYIPENLRLGNSINSFFEDNRVIVGTNNGEESPLIKKILKKLKKPIKWMSWESAELSKHAINAWLANSIVFINQLSKISECYNANISDVSEALQSEDRIGLKSYLKAGQAFSGGTLGRDIDYLSKIKHSSPHKINYWQNIQDLNDHHKLWPMHKISSLFDNMSNIKIAVSGLTYKNNTNTLRGSHALEFCKWAVSNGAKCSAWEQLYNDDLVDDSYNDLSIFSSFYDAIRGVDVLIIYRLPKEINKNDFQYIAENVKSKTIIDCSNQLDQKNIYGLKILQVGK